MTQGRGNGRDNSPKTLYKNSTLYNDPGKNTEVQILLMHWLTSLHIIVCKYRWKFLLGQEVQVLTRHNT